ncbi:MAG: hypothetical protein IJM79_07790 [Erysipelotrichaceae bacterium]|nr:hypothetical protein [Erysipelotrichaceae bacterium]
MSETRVKFYRGTHGMGIVISVTYDSDRIIFDFGAPFTPLAQVYDGIVRQRETNRVKDAVLLGRIPEVGGVFARRNLQDLSLESYEDSPYHTAIFICHLHLDHMSEIDKVHPAIPVYIHEDGLKLQKTLEEIGWEKHYRDYSAFRHHETIEVGRIKVTPFFSDHPCPGSSGFLIETPDSVICYSGDIRFHGTQAEKAWKEIEEVSRKKIDLLIVDSTTTSPSEFLRDEALEQQYRIPGRDYLPGSLRVQDIYDGIEEQLKDFAGLGVVNCYPRDVRMLAELKQLAENIDRTMVFEPAYACILYKCLGIKSAVIWPDNDETHPYHEKLKREFPEVTAEQIVSHPENYLLQNSYRNILSLIDLDGLQGRYYHLLGEPLVEGMKEYGIMQNMIARLGWQFRSFINLYSFSHAYPNHLAELIRVINAKTVVAVHSKHPENLNPVNSEQFFPREGCQYVLKDGRLSESGK